MGIIAMEDIKILFFYYLGEALLLVFVGLAFFGRRLSWPRLLAVSGAYGFSIWVVRGVYKIYGIPFGSHTLILTLLLFLWIKFIGKMDWDIAVGASLTGMTLILLGSWFTDFIVNKLNIKWRLILDNLWLHILFGYTENIFLILMLALNKFFNFTFVKAFNIGAD